MFTVRSIIKYLNSIPFPVTTKHYYAFDRVTNQLKDGQLSSAESWDILRQNHPHFSIPTSREEWLKTAEVLIKKDGQDGALIERAKIITRIVERLNIASVFSAGVGGAGLEYQIKKNKPEVKLTCSEYSPVNVAALKKVFLECDSIILFDMKKGDWREALIGVDPRKQLCLLYRIDIDFSNQELVNLFSNMARAGVYNILIIICGRLTLRGWLNRYRERLKWRMKSVPYSFVGFLRSEKVFSKLWDSFYTKVEEFDCGGLKGFLLRRKDIV